MHRVGGYRFVSPSAPLSPNGNLPLLFSPTGIGGQNVTRNGGPQIGACLILSDILPATASLGLSLMSGRKMSGIHARSATEGIALLFSLSKTTRHRRPTETC